eukprot:COSAG02_NODE_93_length_37477_cov_78.101129_14_plen_93_part_00
MTGATFHGRGEWKNIDSDLAGFIALCSVLGKLNEVNLSDCHLGPASVAELAKAFSDADAALTKIDIRGADIDEELFAGLKGVAPEGCEVLWK